VLPRIVAALEATENMAVFLMGWRAMVGDIVERGDPGSHVGRLEIRDYRGLFELHEQLADALKEAP
jgi:hypothetical protein